MRPQISDECIGLVTGQKLAIKLRLLGKLIAERVVWTVVIQRSGAGDTINRKTCLGDISNDVLAFPVVVEFRASGGVKAFLKRILDISLCYFLNSPICFENPCQFVTGKYGKLRKNI